MQRFIKKSIFVELVFVLLLCPACSKKQKVINTEKTITDWTGKVIDFPPDVQYKLVGKNADVELHANLLESEFKILLYVDSTGCTECKLALWKWKGLIADIDTLSKDNISFLFFFHPKDKKELQFLFLRDNFNYPVFIDETDEINRLNNFPKEEQYQCFLLDKDNRVLAIGNPVQNPKVWELYKKIIKEKTLLD